MGFVLAHVVGVGGGGLRIFEKNMCNWDVSKGDINQTLSSFFLEGAR